MGIEGTPLYQQQFDAVTADIDKQQLQALGEAITPSRWAGYLQDSVVQYCSTSDYTIGALEREAIAEDIINESIENGQDAELAMEALIKWRSIYGA